MEENELENETPAETPEVEAEMPEETSTDTVLTEDDYYREKARADEAEKKAATALAQKEHYRKKAEQPKVALPETNKPQNDEALKLIRDEAILFAKGYTEEEVDLAARVSKINGVSMLEAINDDYVKAQVSTRIKKEKAEKASLGVSSGTGLKTSKPVGEMTTEEHEKFFHRVMGN